MVVANPKKTRRALQPRRCCLKWLITLSKSVSGAPRRWPTSSCQRPFCAHQTVSVYDIRSVRYLVQIHLDLRSIRTYQPENANTLPESTI